MTLTSRSNLLKSPYRVPITLENESLISRAREVSPTRRFLREIMELLPADDGELDALLGRMIDEREPEIFTNLLVAAMAAGRRPDARHLVRGGPLLLNPNPIGVAVHHMSGNVGGALVEAVRGGQMGSEREAASLAAAAAWGQRQDPPVVPPPTSSRWRACCPAGNARISGCNSA